MQNIIEFTSVWYNLPFTLMLVATLVLCLLQLIGLDDDAESSDGDADAEMGEADHEIEISPLAIIGFGKAPTLLVLSIFIGLIGLVGWAINSIIVRNIYMTGLVFAVTLILSVAISSLLTRTIAEWIGRALPPIFTSASRAVGLIGKQGTLLIAPTQDKFGVVRVRNAGGITINVFAIWASGSPTDDPDPPNAGRTGPPSTVTLIDYDDIRRVYQIV
ncbi:MAG: YqiJ family protein [Anaerolineae bacterium]|nr:YqiJ family protein [Anaerolineae bacterium]